MDIKLGKLEKVDLRYIWNSEAIHFTPWLAREENLKLLGESVGLELELEAQEKDVGPFRADILCKEVSTSSWVLIENQLEKTDHLHLGQLMTYAAGLKAVNIVWIAERFTDEHRAALDWLNEITDPQINFFGIEVELWKIGTSEAAPKFNVISKPNDWAKVVTQSANVIRDKELTDSKKLQFEFWVGFSEHAKKNSRIIRPTKPFPQHWMFIAVGRSGFKLCAIASVYNNDEETYDSHEVRAEFVIDGENARSYYDQLFLQKDEIEKEMGEPLKWHTRSDKNMCRIGVRKTTRIDDLAVSTQNYEWVLQKLERLHGVFSNRIKNL